MEDGRYPAALIRVVTAAETALARRAAAVLVPGDSRVPRWRDVGIEPLVLPNVGFEDAAPRSSSTGSSSPNIDLAYCGTLGESRRLDLLIALAEARPDIRIVVCGKGRVSGQLSEAATRLGNLEYQGWTDAPDTLLASARCVYYGLDPGHAYSEKACPNTLYQALRVHRPLLFFCGGEPGLLAEQFAIGIRCAPSAAALANAVDQVRSSNLDWEFAPALASVDSDGAISRFAALFASGTAFQGKGLRGASAQ